MFIHINIDIDMNIYIYIYIHIGIYIYVCITIYQGICINEIPILTEITNPSHKGLTLKCLTEVGHF